mgnify:FL=1|jgi:hypothetical protein|tara:strand:- start:2356 stop:3084 length:729 start_codon:yes stop_codon:yes gene_type:complete
MNTKLSKIMKDMTPTYTFKLPLSKKTVKYRPFLVKEERILAEAQSNKNPTVKDEYTMLHKIISNCTDLEDIESLMLCELELVFLKLRSKSMGNKVSIPHTPEGEEDSIMLDIDLDTVEISGEVPDNRILIDDKIGLRVSPPTLSTLLAVDSKTSASDMKNNFTEVLNIIENSIKEIFTEDEIIDTEELSSKDLRTFVENLPTSAMEKITKYFDDIPALKQEVTYKAGNKTKTVTLQGLDSFI